MRETIFTPDVRFDPYWWEGVPRENPTPEALPPVLPNETDVLIIGSGFTGLMAAIHIARAGRDALVLDADTIGFGASTRNGGMIGSGHRLSHDGLTGKYGDKAATAILQEGRRSLAFTTAFIENEAIDCDYRNTGRLRVAWTPAHFDAMKREAEIADAKTGVPMTLVEKTDVGREIASDAYHGGCIYPEHGGLDPARFHRGLLERARSAGATVQGNTRVMRITRTKTGFSAMTERGTVTARDVIVATNGYSGKAVSWFARRVVPASSYIIATEPLGRETIDRLFPTGRMIVETRDRHCYFRPSPDHTRILFGARAALARIDPAISGVRNRALLLSVFPELADVKISHSWQGHIAFTLADIPAIGVRDGLHYALGYGGSGVAMAPYLGYKVAMKVLGEGDAGRTAYDHVPFRAIPFYDGRPWFLPLMDAWYRVRDWRQGSG